MDVNSLIAQQFPPASRDNERPLGPDYAVGYRQSPGSWSGIGTDVPTADPPSLDSAGEMKSGSAMPASARGAQQRWPGANADQRCGSKSLADDPGLVVPVIASPEEVFRARELREQIKREYLNRPSQHDSLWCVGVD